MAYVVVVHRQLASVELTAAELEAMRREVRHMLLEPDAVLEAGPLRQNCFFSLDFTRLEQI